MKNVLKFFIFFSMINTIVYANAINKSIVKIYTVSKAPNYQEPWNSVVHRSSGSGSIISGNRILTNAHVVANQTFLEVKKYGDTKRYQARVLQVSHDTDLALLEVEDKDFFKDTVPLTFGTLPNMQDKVTVYGYPMGGNTISISTGIVSRIEHNRYVHSGQSFLSIQIDAAINPGNSGGPTISDGKIVGVVMQQISRAQNIGYMVPIDVVQHFLKDVEDGTYDGFPKLGIYMEKIENPTQKEYYKLDEKSGGILVVNILYTSPFRDVLKKDDIITAIDGHKIESDGTVYFRENQYTHFKYYIDLHQYGEEVALDILREGKKISVKVKLTTEKNSERSSFADFEYDKMPTYFMLGGYVFTPLTQNLLNASNQPNLPLRYGATKFPTQDNQEIIILLKVLASKISRGDYGVSFWKIDKVNGKKFKDFKEFYKLVTTSKDKYIILEDNDGSKIIINRKKALEIQDEFLQRYSIKATESPDLNISKVNSE
ncbi:MAG TPA: serine protease [Campylobacterales bacterium]|nr:serine protease [Campylobacterales bacterium]